MERVYPHGNVQFLTSKLVLALNQSSKTRCMRESSGAVRDSTAMALLEMDPGTIGAMVNGQEGLAGPAGAELVTLSEAVCLWLPR